MEEAEEPETGSDDDEKEFSIDDDSIADREPAQTEEELLRAVRRYVAFKDQYGELGILRQPISMISRHINDDSELKALSKGWKVIERAEQADADSLEKAIASLDELIAERGSGTLCERATRVKEMLQSQSGDDARSAMKVPFRE